MRNAMNTHIFTTNSTSIDTKFFCLKGQEDFIDENGFARMSQDSDKVSAKIISDKKPKHFNSTTNYLSYYIKASPSMDLFNPVELLCPVKDKDNYNFINAKCKESWSFYQVTKQTFDKYITFLNTKNLSWLKAAERDIK